MIFQKDILLAGLRACEKLINKSPTPIMETVRLFTEDGQAKLWAANPLAAIEYNLGTSDYQIDICVEPTRLTKILKSLKQPTVELSLGQGLTINTVHGDLNVPCEPGSEYPRLKMLLGEPEPLAKVNTDDLKEAVISAARYTSAGDMLVTTGVKISVQKDRVVVYGSDTRCFIRISIPAEGNPAEYIVSREIGPYLSVLESSECELVSVGEFVAVRSGAWRLTMNGKTTNYPSATIDKIVEAEMDFFEVNSSEFHQALEMVGGLSDGTVSVDHVGGSVTIRGLDLVQGTSGEQILPASGSSVSLLVKYDQLLHPLKLAMSFGEKVKVNFKGPIVRIQPCEGWDFAQAQVAR